MDQGDRLALVVPNSRHVIAFYACQRLGAMRGRQQPAVHEARDGASAGDAEPAIVLVADLLYADFAGVLPPPASAPSS
jgi:acyl-coenzyme A synthetase/AMP-(fatty) acid ligase